MIDLKKDAPFEVSLTKDMFNIKDAIEVQEKNTIEIVMNESGLYECLINRVTYCAEITPMFALMRGIYKFRKSDVVFKIEKLKPTDLDEF